MGITNFAQKELGDIVHVDLPDLETEFVKGDAICCVESTKTAADIYQMVDGEVIEVNDTLDAEPELINTDPEGNGWIMKIKIQGDDNIKNMLDKDAYAALCEKN